ncbi:hemagglutinin repeat-containing protein (plasmid) [Enterobacter sp. JBIWA003]|uniref:hemagglutinin repeat-containing protein n=1 Tax=Enterobacter sp. JBIWA003 TaxID=2831890 RepID=UPI001CBCEB03|nr:hemagglutinin repeat-containing protein [Enterobacter sp. JBIWA003]UAN24660.1 hemagglutinin repeat-containing protein [Enterobacter sp. JBIWA003]
MNKNLYRIVFNTARGMLMVVPDIAGAGRAGAASSPSGTGHTLSQMIGKVHGLSFAVLLALGAIQPVQANIVADGSAPGNQQPTIISSANGTPQVNIQTPSAEGVSRNVYSQFDIDNKGVVLNNSHLNTQTQIAGMVTANPWLAKGEAKVILNEVNASNPSQLNGFIEVAGQKAQVVIANPAGITCSGCGFINANRATLTTGQAQMTNGQLTGYNVERGEIVIQGKGLDSSLQDHTDLIARSVKINAGLWANDLAVTTGRNEVDAAHQTVAAKTADGDPRPQVAVDVSQLGGMYANKIRLLGTEAGVGVHNAGALNAIAGDVVVNADGMLTNSGAINASQAVQVTTTGDINNSGKLYAGADTQVQSRSALTNSGILAAQGNTTLTTASINSTAQGVLAAGMASNGKLGSSGNLTLNSQGQLNANGQNSAAGQLSATGTALDFSGSQTYGNNIVLQATVGDIRTAGANLAATQTLSARTGGMLNNDGGKLSADQLSLTANSLSNQQGTVQQLEQQDLTLSHVSSINNRAGTIASNSKNLTLNTANLNNQQGTLVHAGDGALIIQATQMNGDKGAVLSNGSLALSGTQLQLDNTTTQAGNITLNAGSLSHRGGQMTQTGSGTLNLNVTDLLDNQEGEIFSNGALSLTAGTLNNQQGQLIAADKHDVTLTLDGALYNRDGLIAADGRLISLSGAVDNTGGLMQAGSTLSLNSRGAEVLNRNSGAQGGIVSAGDMQLATGNLDNRNGQIAASTLNARTGTLNNAAGKILADKGLTLSSGVLNNQAGNIQSGAVLTLNTHGQTLDNSAGGLIGATGALSLASGAVDNRQGKLVGGGDTLLRTGLLDNRGGQLASLSNLSLFNTGLLNDDGGLLQSAADLAIDTQGGTLINTRSGDQGGITSQGSLTLKTAALDNQQGVLIGNQQLTLTSGAVNNQQGQIAALGSINALTQALNNAWGTLQSGQNLQWNTQGDGLDNQHGTFSAQGDLSLTSADANNQYGLLASGGAMALNTAAFDNSLQGNLFSKGTLDLTASNINSQQGQIQALGNMALNAVQSVIDNRAGLIQGALKVTLNAATILNQNTLGAQNGIQGGSLTLSAQDVDNSQGALRVDDALTLNLSGSLNNTSGLLSAQNSLHTLAQQVTNRAGAMEAGQQLNLTSGSLTGDGSLLSLGDMSLTLVQDFFNTGSVQAGHDLGLTTKGTLTNRSLIQAGNKLDLVATNLFNSTAAEISAGTTQLTATQTLTNYGLIDGFYTRLNSTAVNNIGSGRIYGDALAIQAGTLNNQAENGQAATIAARQRLDLGGGTLNNYDHALIYSDGFMTIGGALDGSYQAIGQGGVLNNHSSTIESAGDMALNIAQINNINDHFSLESVLVSQEHVSEYEVARLNNGVRYNDKDYTIYIYKDEVNILCIEGVICHTTDGDRFTRYDYTRTITEDRVKESDPAKILVGGNLSINAGSVLNDKSQIIAGGALALQGGSLNNVEVEANRQINDVGTATYYSRHQSKGGDSSNVDVTAYKPPTVIQAITLKPSTLAEYTQSQGSNLVIDAQQQADINGDIQGAVGINATPIAGPGAGNLLPVVPGAITLPAGKTFEVNLGDSGKVVRLVGPNTRLPDNSLFRVRPDSSPYLVETDPRFTDKKQWLGSDYMMNAFTTDPNNVLKRLGDGYYEQRLIREQVIALSGNRYLDGFQNDEEQYKALMNNGVEFGKKYNLTLGVALTAEQMALLTGDIVWMVAQTVPLPDGSTRQVLVPQVYASVKAGDLDGSGALLAGKTIGLNLSGNLTNSGRINGQQSTQILAENISNLGGLIQGNDVALKARTDISNVGGVIAGQQSLTATAGRDINATTTTRSAKSAGGDFARTTLDRVAGLYVQQPDGTLALQAGRDVNLTAAQIVNSGEGGSTSITAGRDLNLNTVTTGSTDNLNWGDNWQHHSSSQQVGSEIVGAGNVQLGAGQDVNITAGNVSAGDKLSVAAGNDINIQHGVDTNTLDQHYKATGSSGMLSKTTTESRDTISQQTVNGSQLSGDTVSMQAGRDLTVTGSSVAATQDVNLTAGNNLNLQAATEQRDETHMLQEKKSGLSGTGGIGFSYGTSDTKTTDDGKSRTSVGSTVGSTQGNVTLNAGNSLTVQGSDVLAGKDINLTGKEVNVLAAENQSTRKHVVEQKQSGLTLALSGTVGSAVSSAVSSASDASKESNGRLAALQGMKAALSGVQAAQANEVHNAGDENTSLVGLNLSWGSQSSKSEQTTVQSQSQGSTLTAGNNLNIRSTGTDINVQGSQLQAGKDINLNAARDVNLLSARNTQTVDGRSESQGGSVGVGVNFGQGKNGLTLNASVNKGKGSESGNMLTHTETTLNAGNNLNITSGRDTTLTGAQVSGEKVTMDVGRNLTLTSERDSDNYDSKQQNASAGGSVGFGSASGSVNLSRDRMHSTYDAVQEQTGVFAGKGGFDITVGEHTQLNGAVIGSTATADKNKLDTGTLGFSNIENKARYDVEHQSVGISSGGSIGGQFAGNMANGLLTGVNGSGSASSTTQSAVSDGTITIRDQANQKQDVAGLSRDVENANPGLNKIFDKEKEQNRLREAQLIGEIGSQAADIARTQGDINGLKAAKEKYPDKTTEQLRETKEYKDAMKQYGTGSALQQGIQAATAAIQGLAGGDMAKALAGASAPYLAEVIHNMTTSADGKIVNTEANLMAHAVLGAVTAAVNGNSALAGASGAVMGEFIAQQMYPGIDRNDLTEEQRQTISALGTLAAGLVGGVVGDSSANVVAGALAGKNAVENNFLGATSSDKLDKAIEKIRNGDKSLEAANDLLKLENADKRSDALVSKFTKDPSEMTSTERAELAGYLRVYASEMENTYGPAVAQQLVTGLLSGQDYMKRDPDSEAMSKAQSIMNTWGYHKSNASIGDAPVMFGGSVLGLTVKGMAANAAIGVGVNSAAQFAGKDPFSYVDAIMAGVTAAATTGKGIIVSTPINMGGAAIGSGIKGEDPTNSVIGAGFGSVVGGAAGKVITDKAAGIVKDTTADLTGTVGGSAISEVFGNGTKELLDQAGKQDEKK